MAYRPNKLKRMDVLFSIFFLRFNTYTHILLHHRSNTILTRLWVNVLTPRVNCIFPFPYSYLKVLWRVAKKATISWTVESFNLWWATTIMFAGICNTTKLIFYHQEYFPILQTWNFCEYTRIDISVRLIIYSKYKYLYHLRNAAA